MKNRTIIGIICMVLAVVISFAVAPIVSKSTTDTVTVVRLCSDVQRGSRITEANLETVSVKKDSLPARIITDTNMIVGKYAVSNLYSGDYITDKKISIKANTAEDVIYGLNGSKFAMSFTIDSFAAGLSGKIKNGDIISLVVNDPGGKSVMPAAFKYVKVITTTTSGGVDQDSVIKNDDGSFAAPATITLLVNATQAQLLADYEEGTISCILVYRGTEENANKFLSIQDEYFTKNSITHNTTETENTEVSDNG